MNHENGARVPFTVLIVCTANQCRSPMAEVLLQRATDELGLDWAISSAGTQAVDGLPMQPHAVTVMQERGLDVTGFRSAGLTRESIESADLVLAAEAAHRSQVVTLCPAALPRSFTLLQFARLASYVASLPQVLPGLTVASAGPRLVEAVIDARSHVQPVPPHDDDIEDPIGRRKRAYRMCADRIDTAVTATLAPLRALAG